jgi:cytochrome c-type biogenesis protein
MEVVMGALPMPLAAFAAGLISFLSPCVLPLVPGYVSLISGNTVEELRSKHRRLRTVLLNSGMFIVGFSVVFILLGAVASGLGQLVRQYYAVLARVAGLVIIVFGLHLSGILQIRALLADKRFHEVPRGSSPWGSFVVGFAFAFGWTPCIGPILAGILALAASTETIMRGIGLLAVYAAGLAIPFLLTSLAIDRFLHFYQRFQKHLRKVEVASGALLIVLGVLIFTRQFGVLSGYLSFLNQFSI